MKWLTLAFDGAHDVVAAHKHSHIWSLCFESSPRVGKWVGAMRGSQRLEIDTVKVCTDMLIAYCILYAFMLTTTNDCAAYHLLAGPQGRRYVGAGNNQPAQLCQCWRRSSVPDPRELRKSPARRLIRCSEFGFEIDHSRTEMALSGRVATRTWKQHRHLCMLAGRASRTTHSQCRSHVYI